MSFMDGRRGKHKKEEFYGGKWKQMKVIFWMEEGEGGDLAAVFLIEFSAEFLCSKGNQQWRPLDMSMRSSKGFKR